MNKQVTAAFPQGLPATLLGFTPQERGYWLEPGLPFIGELIWPHHRYRKLSQLTYWTVPTDCMAPRFPKGTVVAVKCIRRARDLKPGLYVWCMEWAIGAPTVLFGRLQTQRRGALELTYDVNPEHHCWCPLWWKAKGFRLWRVTHYAHFAGACSTPKRKPTKKRYLQEVTAKERVLEGAAAISLQFAPGAPRHTTLISPQTALAISRLVQADLRQKIDELQGQLTLQAAKDLLAQPINPSAVKK